MKLSIDEVIHFTSFIRRADNEGLLDAGINIYGTDPLGYSMDPRGAAPYYRYVTLAFEDEDGEEHEISFSDTTMYLAQQAIWRLVDALPIT